MKKIAFYSAIMVGLFTYSCSDPSQSAAEQSATEANDTDSSSSNTHFNSDTTVNMNSGAGVGTPSGKADSISKEGKNGY